MVVGSGAKKGARLTHAVVQAGAGGPRKEGRSPAIRASRSKCVGASPIASTNVSTNASTTNPKAGQRRVSRKAGSLAIQDLADPRERGLSRGIYHQSSSASGAAWLVAGSVQRAVERIPNVSADACWPPASRAIAVLRVSSRHARAPAS